MVGTAVMSSSPCLPPISFPKHRCSHFPLSASSTIPHQTFVHLSLHHNHKTRQRTRNPRIFICHGKLNGGPSREEAAEELEEAFFGDDEEEIEDESDEEDEEERESSADLLVRFIQSMFKKFSKRAKKATRSILPPAISPQLVSFAVDGVLLLTLLSIVKALLQVLCTLGGTVFVAILLVRVVWTTISHFQSNGNNFNQSTTGSSTQPVM